MKRVAVFVSGGGTDLQSVLDANAREKFCEIALVLSSKHGVFALERARRAGVPTEVVARKDFPSEEAAFAKIRFFLREYRIDYVVLAGYLSILPPDLTREYAGKIVNVHPSLIPSFCGKGYYGLRVHEAVLAYGAKVTGATVHFVDEGADTGAIILQKAVDVLPDDTAESLQKRVLEVEHEILPRAVRLLAEGKLEIDGRKVTVKENRI